MITTDFTRLLHGSDNLVKRLAAQQQAANPTARPTAPDTAPRPTVAYNPQSQAAVAPVVKPLSSRLTNVPQSFVTEQLNRGYNINSANDVSSILANWNNLAQAGPQYQQSYIQASRPVVTAPVKPMTTVAPPRTTVPTPQPTAAPQPARTYANWKPGTPTTYQLPGAVKPVNPSTVASTPTINPAQTVLNTMGVPITSTPTQAATTLAKMLTSPAPTGMNNLAPTGVKP